ncbi:sterol carrier family protein [Jannaschia sp. EhC01]|uniref:SCP2 sterol-binding domain-containing protein n=1 Tax=Gymnodinialimonas phycosphaerae TaxID=2841589 RepID=A0A975TYX9_9RHOB|nr:SCP2 sterol-binding domain-containing protein [Gymnodinialimonas phycosphaerae]MBY4893109.1 SCP2 sterol-binding domain-containing protein [Gymnodinialimonas phycosphaerae]OAN76120.1 sterol carrier family protein [Jannaschia sp. EhC01]
MSNAIIEAAVAALSEKMAGADFDGTAKFEIEGEGAVIVDGTSVRAAEDGEAADVTMSADADVFQEIMSGELNPTAAFMSGKLSLDGDMGTAMKLGSALS